MASLSAEERTALAGHARHRAGGAVGLPGERTGRAAGGHEPLPALLPQARGRDRFGRQQRRPVLRDLPGKPVSLDFKVCTFSAKGKSMNYLTPHFMLSTINSFLHLSVES